MSTKMMYVVYRQGVERHEILGVFDDVELAKMAARTSAENEPDDYHTIEVAPIPLNEAVVDVSEQVAIYRKDLRGRRQLPIVAGEMRV